MKPFTDVSFPTEHPAARVAEHEVLMAFVNDGDAALFQDWWERWGKHLFGDYAELAKRGTPNVARKPGIPSREEMYSILKARSDEIKAKSIQEQAAQERWYDDE